MCRAFDCTVKVIRVWVLIFLTLTDVIKAAFLTVFLTYIPALTLTWSGVRGCFCHHTWTTSTHNYVISLIFFFCLTQTYHKTHILHLFSANKEHFNKELTQNLQHLFQTCPLLSSTLFHRCTHTHKHTHFVQFSLAHVFWCCIWCFCPQPQQKGLLATWQSLETTSAHKSVLCFQSVLSYISQVRDL